MEKSVTERSEEMKRYLYCEIDENEQTSIEDKMFEDESYFNDLEMLENDLIDKYARNELAGEEKKRFERSLIKVKDRKAKVAEAMALHSYIIENKQIIAPFLPADEPEKKSLFVRIKEFFNFRGFSIQYALAGLILLFAIGLVFLIYSNYQANQEISRLRNLIEQKKDLKDQINAIQDRLNNLKQQEIEEKSNLENKLNELHRQNDNLAEEIRQKQNKLQNLPDQQIQEPGNVIAQVKLPGGDRGDDKPIEQPVKLKKAVSQVRITIPFSNSSNENFRLELNGHSVKSRRTPENIILIVSRKRLHSGKNSLIIKDSLGVSIMTIYLDVAFQNN